ncbi:MAG: hypothetical protein ACTSP1_05845 [Candidatus Freyarchaeota archaeon]
MIKKVIVTSAVLIELLALNILIDTLFFKIVFSLIALTFICYFLLIEKQYMLKIKAQKKKKKVFIGFVYALATISGILLLNNPFLGIIIDPNLISNSFLTLSVSSILRIIAGYYLTCFFPGIIIVTRLSYFKNKDLIEKLGLLMIFSIIYSAITGSIMLVLFHLFDPYTFTTIFVISLIIFSGIVETLKYVKSRNNRVYIDNWQQVSNTYSLSLEKIFLIIIILSYVSLSYFQVFMAAPLSGLLWSDPANYAIFANRYVYYNVYYWAYVGTPIFLKTISYVVGLPAQLSFAGLQFLQALLPLAVYTSVNKILKNERVSLIATFFVFFLNGVTSLVLLLDHYQLGLYITHINQLDVLWNLYKMTGAPGAMNPNLLVASTFDISLGLFSIAYAYEYLTRKKKDAWILSLSSLLAGAAIFFHGLNFGLLPILLWIILLIAGYKEKDVFFLLSFTVVIVLFFDFISGFYFLSYFIPLRISTSGIVTTNSANFTISFVVSIILLSFLVAILCIRRIVKTLRGLKISIILSFRHAKRIFTIIGILIFLLATVLYLKNANFVSHVAVWSTSAVFFPWFFIVYKYYGVILSLAIISIPYLTKAIGKGALSYLVFITISILSIAILSLIFPTMLPIGFVYYRYVGYLIYPLAIFAAIPLLNLQEKNLFKAKNNGLLNKKNKVLFLLLIILPSLTITQVISQAHSYEVWYLIGQKHYISFAIVDSINWINYNLPKGSTILPLQESSEKALCNLAYDFRVIPISFPEFNKLLYEQSFERITYILSLLKVNYVYATENDLSYLKKLNSGLLYVLNVSTVVYNNSNVIIYKLSYT